MTSWQQSFSTADLDHLRPYDAVLVPALFHPWATYLAGVLAPPPGSRALDIACGPGTVTRVLATLIGPGGRVTGVDINPAMLDIATAKAANGGAPTNYIQSAAAPLPDLPNAAVDLTCCQHGLQFFPDKPAAVAEWHRVTIPGGRVGVAIWSGLDRNPLFRALHSAVDTILGPAAAERFRTPWALEPSDARGLLAGTGFTDIQHHTATLPITFPAGPTDLHTVYHFSAVAADIKALEPTERTALHDEILHGLQDSPAQGPLHGTTSAEIITATR
ncbi:MAG: methyltransferase domain-containing protein [Actinophytocola sp.]|uniref:methyltransferase domain-containing protein n=1 Tax=Actinophytocola sp. TaxID=1872138 RepID=UPI003C78A608